MNLMIYLIVVNIITFILCVIDKKKSIYHLYRIPENTLLFLSLIGGCFGMLVGMNLMHHKTRKLKFKLVYLLCILWIILLYYVFF